MGNVHMEATQINYRGGASKMNVEEAIKSAIELTPEQKTNINKIPTIEAAVGNKTDQDVIASEFDAEAGVYAVGDLVMHEGKLYEFTSAHETAGDWNAEEVSEKTVSDEIDTVKSGFTNLDNEVNGDATTYPYADVITINDAVPANLAECNVKIDPVQSGSGDPSPTNIRPITGHTEVSVDRVGFNIWDGTATDGKGVGNNGTLYNDATLFATGYVRVFPNVTYYLNDTNWKNWVWVFDGSKTALQEVRVNTTNRSIVFPSGTVYARFTGILDSKSTACINVFDSALNGSYAPYAGKTYTLALGDTIYGGTVDFDSGVMTVTMAQIASYDGGTIGEPWMSDMDVYAAGTTPTTGAQVVYTLAEPLTVQLTSQQIQLLKGQNTLTASTGKISVTVNGVSGSIGAVQEQANATDAALAELAEQLPDAPATDGTYVLTVTVADGTPTYSWESAT